MKKGIFSLIPLLLLSSCQVIYPSSYHAFDELTVGKERYVLQTDGARIGRLEGSEWMHKLKKHPEQPTAVSVGQLKDGRNITLLPSLENSGVFFTLSVGAKVMKTQVAERTCLTVDTAGRISTPDRDADPPSNWVCRIIMFGKKDGVIAWHEKNGGFSLLFLPQEKEEPAHGFRRFVIDASAMPWGPPMGEELLKEER